uniref:Uncharacterized protein n=1 Tax=Panagrolaimus sp. ES5 TaxID=591445 RepID=A0AC34FV31_9BILA
MTTKGYDSGEKDELKKPNSANSSTLSLHIEVYENFVETKKELNGNEKEDNESEKSDFTRKLQITKQIFIGSPSLIQNHFEFPRQQEDQTDQPELMQFKASQRLLNPNHLAATGS